MTSKRQKELTLGPDPQCLTPDELAEGWHWCEEWDGLMLGPECCEWGDNPEKCRCGYFVPAITRKSKP